jgi:hypothetical protein
MNPHIPLLSVGRKNLHVQNVRPWPDLYQYPNTNIQIVKCNNYQGNYQDDVVKSLDHISLLFPQFLTQLTQTGKTIRVVYNGMGDNQIAGNNDGGSYVIRYRHTEVVNGHITTVAFGHSLQVELTSNHLTAPVLAAALPLVGLPGWNGHTRLNPFALMTVPNRLARVTGWLAGTANDPTDTEMDVLVMCLTNPTCGPGCDVRIYWDPQYVVNRPAIVGLFHELVHAYYLTKGANPGIIESTREGDGGRHFELMAVGMPPYHDREFSENKLRGRIGVGPRNAYP